MRRRMIFADRPFGEQIKNKKKYKKNRENKNMNNSDQQPKHHPSNTALPTDPDGQADRDGGGRGNRRRASRGYRRTLWWVMSRHLPLISFYEPKSHDAVRSPARSSDCTMWPPAGSRRTLLFALAFISGRVRLFPIGLLMSALFLRVGWLHERPVSFKATLSP